MDLVVDTSALLAVIVGAPERARILALTSGHTIIGPESIPWEVGNAFTAMLKQRRLTLADAQEGFRRFQTMPLRYAKVDMARALALADRAGIYAYDAYFLECAARHSAPLLTLDGGLGRSAMNLGIKLLEV